MLEYTIEIDAERCRSCQLCVRFCPVEVFADGPVVRAPELCWGCETCAGQCPEGAIRVVAQGAGGGAGGAHGAGGGSGGWAGGCAAGPYGAQVAQGGAGGGAAGLAGGPDGRHATAEPLPAERQQLLASWSQTLKRVLGLDFSPVAITLIGAGEPWPDAPIPAERMRYCQSLIAARRGNTYLMPANRHACPDGTAILGLTELPPKLASGELYKLFHKLDSVQAARQMVQERPSLPPRSIAATLVAPLEAAVAEPQVIAVFAQPEQVMWLCMSASYYTGHRFDFKASGYNAQCVETTLIPYLSGQPNISFGCYGCRAASDIAPDLMFMGIPVSLMPTLLKGLNELNVKAIPQSRAKIYLAENLPQEERAGAAAGAGTDAVDDTGAETAAGAGTDAAGDTGAETAGGAGGTAAEDYVEKGAAHHAAASGAADDRLFQLRPAEPRDLDGINLISAESGFGSFANVDNIAVAVNDQDQTVGFLHIELVKTAAGQPEAYIYPVATYSAWRHLGVGSALVSQALERYGQLFLVACSDSQGFYINSGFQEIPMSAVAPQIAADCDACADQATCRPRAYTKQLATSATAIS